MKGLYFKKGILNELYYSSCCCVYDYLLEFQIYSVKKMWSKIGSALMAMYGLIMTCGYVFMILITELGI